MSNNGRPYRATITGPLRTTHYDYPSKEERGSWSHTPAKFTTVTSRKPVTRGEPVCWVNVFAESHRPSAHTTKVLADQYGQDRLHCIPVYLPGEGAATVSDMAVNSVSLAAQLRLANEHIARLSLERDNVRAILTDTTNERDAAKADVKLLTDSVDGLTSASEANDARYAELEERWKSAIQERDEARRLHSKAEGEVECRNQMRAQHAQEIKDWRHTAEAKQREVERLTNLAQDWETTARVRAEERDAAKAEVEQWKDAAEHAEGKLSEERMSSQAERKECDKLQAEVDRLTKELAAAQAQAMPAGKVVYGASGKFGINRDFQTIEFADKRLRDTYRKTDGWTWFTRVEES